MKTNIQKRYWKKYFLYFLLIIILFIAALFLSLQNTAVQNFLARKTTIYLSDKTNYLIKVDKVAISWFDRFQLKGVSIKDPGQVEMIAVQNCKINFDFLSLFGKKTNIEEVNLIKPEVRLIKDTSKNDFNINLFIDAFKDSSQQDAESASRPFKIEEINLHKGFFKLYNEHKPYKKKGFDPNHFIVNNINGSLSNFKQSEDTLSFKTHNLTGKEQKTGLKIHELDTDFGISDTYLKFEKLFLHIGKSKIRNQVIFRFNNKDGLSHFNNKVNINATFENTLIRPQELSYFAPELTGFKDTWNISGNFNGKVSDFNVDNFHLKFGKTSNIKGNISIKGLPDFQETLLNLHFDKSIIKPYDIQQYLDEQAIDVLKKFGRTQFSGDFFGFPGDFVTNGKFQTALGSINADINFKLNKAKKPFYEGKISTNNFQLGKFINKENLVGKLDMQGMIRGSGLKPENADFYLKSKIHRLNAWNYNYNNITTNARFAREKFNGSLDIKDSNLVVDAIGEIKLGHQKILDLNVQIEKANLDKLHFSKKACNIKTQIETDFTGNDWKELYGNLKFSNTKMKYDKRLLILNKLNIESEKIGNLKNLTINSELANIRFYGNWKLTYLYEDLSRLYKEYKLQLANNDSIINNYYSLKRNIDNNKYQLYFIFKLKNINPVLKFLETNTRIAKNTRISGDFKAGNYNHFNLYTYFDYFKFKDNTFKNNRIDISISKFSKSPDVLATTTLFSESQKFSNNIKSEELNLEAVWDKQKIDFYGSLRQAEANNAAEINGKLSFLKDHLEVELDDKSHFTLLNKKWKVAEDNNIKINGKNFRFKNIKFFNENQKIALNGTFSEKKSKQAKLIVDNFHLRLLNKLLNENLEGTVNGYMEIRDIYGNLNLESDMTIHDLSVDNFLIGTVKGKSLWDNDKNVFDLNFNIERQEKNILNITGDYDPDNKNNQLNLKAELKETNLVILEPFIQDNFSELKGTGSGTVYISGKPSYPVLHGEININNGAFKINYLNTKYYFNDKIYISENRFGMQSLKLTDANGNNAIVNGGLYHDGFTNWVLNLNADLNKFKILNTNENLNNVYYGKAIASGHFKALGGLNNLKISANLISKKGTDINIPLDSEENVDKQEFIKFVSDNKKDSAKNKKDKVDLNGINLDLNLELTNDANISIIFDKKVGERLEGSGQGQIRLEIDTRGDFNMYGNYTFNEGSYTYNLLYMISKQFKIEKGSSISWSGSPYEGDLDVTAKYEQLTSLKPIVDIRAVDSSFLNQPELQRRYPVSAVLNLKGELLHPDISYGIDIEEYPRTLFNTVTMFESRLQNNPRQLNKQMFSLLVMKRLANINGAFLNNGGAATASTGSVSELLSNQFSYWVSQVDENLQVDLNLDGLDKNALNKVQVRMSYNFMEGRLRVTRAGSFTNSKNQTTASSIAGEWTVEYLLSEDGRFRIKLFNRNNPNVLDVSNNTGNNTTAGFSIMHTENFNNLGELLGKNPSKKSEIKKKEKKKGEEKRKNGDKNSEKYIKEE